MEEVPLVVSLVGLLLIVWGTANDSKIHVTQQILTDTMVLSTMPWYLS